MSVEKLQHHGMSLETLAVGNSLGVNWGQVWLLVEQYGFVVLTILPQILPLLKAGNWVAVIQLILEKLHQVPPNIVPVV